MNNKVYNLTSTNPLLKIKFEDMLSTISIPDDDNYIFDTSDVFLHGHCFIFALALHNAFGYETKILSTASNDKEHCFCVTHINNKELYIDIRGITENFDELIFPFHTSETYDVLPYTPNECELISSETDWIVYAFARSIINKYNKYYHL